MPLLLQIAVLVMIGIGPLYLYSFWRLYAIIKAEKPEWLQRKGSLSFMYEGMPRAFDPNVSSEVIRIAFGSRAQELQSPSASIYAKRIRLLLLSGIVLFMAVIAWALARGA